jgi:hypothetical protein
LIIKQYASFPKTHAKFIIRLNSRHQFVKHPQLGLYDFKISIQIHHQFPEYNNPNQQVTLLHLARYVELCFHYRSLVRMSLVFSRRKAPDYYGV